MVEAILRTLIFFFIADSEPSQSESALASNESKSPFQGCNE